MTQPARVSNHVRRACRAVLVAPSPWPPAPGLADHRLVFLAAQPALRVLSQSRLALFLSVFDRGVGSTTRGAGAHGMTAQSVSVERQSAAMARLVVACDEVGDRLSSDELRLVRASGVLPDWFVPAVAEAARSLRRRR